MTRMIAPLLWRAELRGQALDEIVVHQLGGEVLESELRFKSGVRYAVIPSTGCTIEATMLNLHEHRLPITNVFVARPTDDSMQVHVFAANNHRLFTIYATGIAVDQLMLAVLEP